MPLRPRHLPWWRRLCPSLFSMQLLVLRFHLMACGAGEETYCCWVRIWWGRQFQWWWHPKLASEMPPGIIIPHVQVEAASPLKCSCLSQQARYFCVLLKIAFEYWLVCRICVAPASNLGRQNARLGLQRQIISRLPVCTATRARRLVVILGLSGQGPSSRPCNFVHILPHSNGFPLITTAPSPSGQGT